MKKNKISKREAEKLREALNNGETDRIEASFNNKKRKKISKYKGTKQARIKKKKFMKIRRFFSKKLTLVTTTICVVFFGLTIKLGYEMLIKGPEYRAIAEGQWMREMEIPAKRGNILDRNGLQLAKSVQVYRVDLDTETIKKYAEREKLTLEEVSTSISNTTNIPYEDVYKKITAKDEEGNDIRFSTLTRNLEKEQADNLIALGIYGVIVDKDSKRYYPNNNFLAHALGSTNMDGEGLAGLELYYNDYLKGKSGIKVTGVDGIGQDLPYIKKDVIQPINGDDIILTIDENIQYFAEKAAEKAYEKHNPKRVSVLVTNPNNGEILAMVNKPDFNPNNPYEGFEKFQGENEGDKIQSMWRNWLVNDSFEPGSTFKNITMAAAIEEGLTYESETFVCNGYKQFGDHTVRCWQTWGHGAQTLPEILKNSCNVGFMELGKKLGAEKLNEYIEKFGFGKITGVDLSGEAEGILKIAKDMAEIDLATIAFGQTNSVTGMQLIQSFNAIVNGGNLITPHMLREISHIDQNSDVRVIDSTYDPKIISNIISNETCETMKKYLKFTADDKDKPNSYVEGYSVGVKSGTGEKVDINYGGYAPDKFLASMIAVAPVENPEITIYVAVDEPSAGEFYGGPVAGPVVKELIKDIFTYKESSSQKHEEEEKNILIPEVRGKTKTEVTSILKDLGLDIEFIGSGDIVSNISPLPGNKVKAGTKIKGYSSNGTHIEKSIAVPNLVGLELNEAINILNYLGIQYSSQGYGIVVEQSIDYGKAINEGEELVITLSPKEL